MPRPIEIIARHTFEGRAIHVVSTGRNLYYLGHEVASALGREAGGDTLLERILGAWTADGSMSNPGDYVLVPRRPFVELGLADPGKAEPVVLLRVLCGVEQALVCLGHGDDVDPTVAARVDVVWEGLYLASWDPGDALESDPASVQELDLSEIGAPRVKGPLVPPLRVVPAPQHH
ncbi:MAG: hypothetical protein H6716_28205 [Polyangiaceae bacterium]|nr:hypothetical protein [Polyangiaceae bacterium]